MTTVLTEKFKQIGKVKKINAKQIAEELKGKIAKLLGKTQAVQSVKDILSKKILKTIKKWDNILGQMVEYPKYNNVALGKSLGGELETFGKEVGANVWTAKTDKIFTIMYDLMESRSFERNITDVLNETINQNQGKILFDVTSQPLKTT